MQYQSIRPDAKRDADALKLADAAPTWPIFRLKVRHGAFPVGSVFYSVPSRRDPNRRYLANGVACECPDYQQRSAICAHVRAVRLFEQRQEQQSGSAQEADPTLGIRIVRGRYEEIFGVCDAQWCDEDRARGEVYCDRHTLVDAF